MNRSLTLILFFALILVVSSVLPAFAADRMTYEDYMAKLKVFQDRETAAKAALETENAAIAELKQKIADLEAQIASLWDQIHAAIGVTAEQVAEFNKKLDDIERRLNELSRLSPEQLLARAAELDEISALIDQMMMDPVAKLSEQANRLAQMKNRVESLKNSLPKPKHDMYTVVRGDYLWKIAGKKDIYGDPWKWLRIWSYNRTAIKNPDLIYPKQEFTIPRQLSKDEYLVAKGDHLKKIAGRPEVYGDPFQWTKLYQANKSGQFLSEPNKLYPEQILTIPR